MCRNIKPLFNFDPPATDEEIHDAALQFVRKVSGFAKPSQINQEAFDTAVTAVSEDINKLFSNLKTTAPSRDREVEAARAKERSHKRFGKQIT